MAKKKHVEEHENLERWLVSYADFITLLFAFFTVLYALSNADKAKYQKASESIQRAFLSGGGVFPLRGSPAVPFDKTQNPGAQVPPQAHESGSQPKSENNDTSRVREQIQGLFSATTGTGVQPGQIEVAKTEGGYKIRLGELLLFRESSDKIRKENIPFLYELGKRLSQLGVQIQVDGHTDTVVNVSQLTNWELSLSRAYNVVQFFVEGTNFPKNKIALAGFGDTMPIAGNDTPEGRAKNRRVEISVLNVNKEIEGLDF